jgi:L-fuculose-phosphate aldolase
MGLKSDLIYYSKLCHTNGYVKATDGNLSVRKKKIFILTTATETNKGKLKAADIIKCDTSGKKLQGKKKPSTELKLHLYIYGKRKDVNAIVHTHAKFASAFAAAGLALDKIVFPEIYIKLGKIPLAKYATPSTDEVSASIEKFVMEHNAILLANHGLVTFGRTLEEAYYLTEKVEQFAEISYYARMLGGEKTLTKPQIKKLDDLKTQISKLK